MQSFMGSAFFEKNTAERLPGDPEHDADLNPNSMLSNKQWKHAMHSLLGFHLITVNSSNAVLIQYIGGAVRLSYIQKCTPEPRSHLETILHKQRPYPTFFPQHISDTSSIPLYVSTNFSVRSPSDCSFSIFLTESPLGVTGRPRDNCISVLAELDCLDLDETLSSARALLVWSIGDGTSCSQ